MTTKQEIVVARRTYRLTVLCLFVIFDLSLAAHVTSYHDSNSEPEGEVSNVTRDRKVTSSNGTRRRYDFTGSEDNPSQPDTMTPAPPGGSTQRHMANNVDTIPFGGKITKPVLEEVSIERDPTVPRTPAPSPTGPSGGQRGDTVDARQQLPLDTTLSPTVTATAKDENSVHVKSRWPSPGSWSHVTHRGVNDVMTSVTQQEQQLTSVVQTLQTELTEAESHREWTRSILNVIQEKQISQERDLSYLKDELSSVRRDQTKDSHTLAALKELVADNSWGVADLKIEQDQLRQDQAALKLFNERHNVTLQVSDVTTQDRYTAKAHSLLDEAAGGAGVAAVRRELQELRQQAVWNREGVLRLTARLRYPSRDNRLTEPADPTTTAPPPGESEGDDHPNEIIPSPFPQDVINTITKREWPGTGKDAHQLDKLALKLEDKQRLVEANMESLLQKENQLNAAMDRFSNKFLYYDSELNKVNAMFYNLSFQIASVENRLMANQQKHLGKDLVELQQNFMNFTSQVFHLEQWHNTNSGFVNRTFNNKYAIDQIVENHLARIKTLENLMLHFRQEQSSDKDSIKNQVNSFNETVNKYVKSFSDHNKKASNVFSDVDEKLMEFNTRIKHNDDRLAHVEVKQLNQSLQQCVKVNSDLQQDKRLGDMSVDLAQLEGQVSGVGGQMDRMDRSMSRIYEDLGKHAKTVDELLEQITDISDVIPDVRVLQTEMANLLRDLPKDCDEVEARAPFSRTGVYLVRPEGGSTSAQVHCEFSDDYTWTVVQSRRDGTQSFARDWAAYRTGFGDPAAEFWVGNDALHRLTQQGRYLLRIDMWDLQHRYYVAEYTEFRVDDEESDYRLHVAGYSGNATDALQYSHLMAFSTPDRDHDASSTHCAKFYTAGWWYKHCHYSNLNGRYTVGVVWFNHDRDEWMQLSAATMKIRPLPAP